MVYSPRISLIWESLVFSSGNQAVQVRNPITGPVPNHEVQLLKVLKPSNNLKLPSKAGTVAPFLEFPFGELFMTN